MVEAAPDAIVHQATALADARFGRNFDGVFATTNRLRTEGTDALLAAARQAQVDRFVAQSFASFRNAREGGPVKTEDDPLDPVPVAKTRESQAAMRYLEEMVTRAGGIALHYGGFYGAADDGLVEPVRKRRFPIVGDGAGMFSFIHLDDAAAATALALERDVAGIFNVVDDEPAPVREWLPASAAGTRRQAAAARSPLARTAGRRRGGRRDGNRVPRRVERKGKAGARVAAPPPDLARRLQDRRTRLWPAHPRAPCRSQ